jgi:hypothetical protein
VCPISGGLSRLGFKKTDDKGKLDKAEKTKRQADMFACLILFFIFAPDSEALKVLISNLRRLVCLRFGADMLVPLQGAA